MQTKEWTHIDKSGWGEGPWTHECDKRQWVDEATGLPCLAKRNRMGAWCGYIGIGPDHPDYGKNYGDVDERYEVHGGLTYSGPCQEGPEAETICHVPDPGEPDKVHWFGFDCLHCYDIAPGMEAMATKHGLPRWEDGLGMAYRTLGYVKQQCARLAKQLAEAKEGGWPA